jgi:hypothetical protein
MVVSYTNLHVHNGLLTLGFFLGGDYEEPHETTTTMQ